MPTGPETTPSRGAGKPSVRTVSYEPAPWRVSRDRFPAGVVRTQEDGHGRCAPGCNVPSPDRTDSPFGAQTALDGVSLHVRPGDCYGFIGHNGAGKTTAMRVALGLETCDAGQRASSTASTPLIPREARVRHGRPHRGPGFHGALYGRGNLVLLRGSRASTAPSPPRGGASVEAVGLSTPAANRPRLLPGHAPAARHRAGPARAPEVVLLDEPMNGLDPEGIEEMRRLSAARHARGHDRPPLESPAPRDRRHLQSHRRSCGRGRCSSRRRRRAVAAETGRYAIERPTSGRGPCPVASRNRVQASPAGGIEAGARRSPTRRGRARARVQRRGLRLFGAATAVARGDRPAVRAGTRDADGFRAGRVKTAVSKARAEPRAPPGAVCASAVTSCAAGCRRRLSRDARRPRVVGGRRSVAHSRRSGADVEGGRRRGRSTASSVTAFEAFGCNGLQRPLPLILGS